MDFFYNITWTFFIYAFIGWCAEVIYAAVTLGYFVNRGFLSGPVCPIYGFGVLIVLGALSPLADNLLLLYLGSVVLTSLLEFLAGFLLEKLFSQRWWDYTDMPFNIGGYVCLKFSLLWGLGCVLVVKVAHPAIVRLYSLIPRPIGIGILILFSLAIVTDAAAAGVKAVKFKRGLQQLEEISSRLKTLSDALGSGVAGGTLAVVEIKDKAAVKLDDLKDKAQTGLDELREYTADYKDKAAGELHEKINALKTRQEELTANFKSRYRRILRAFPSMRSTKYRERLEQIKESIHLKKH